MHVHPLCKEVSWDDPKKISKAKKEDSEEKMSIVAHLNEFRKYLFRSAIAIIFFSVIAYFFKNLLFDIIIFSPKEADFITNRLLCLLSETIRLPTICINQTTFNIINIQLAGQFKAHLLISFIAGLMIGGLVFGLRKKK